MTNTDYSSKIRKIQKEILEETKKDNYALLCSSPCHHYEPIYVKHNKTNTYSKGIQCCCMFCVHYNSSLLRCNLTQRYNGCKAIRDILISNSRKSKFGRNHFISLGRHCVILEKCLSKTIDKYFVANIL